MQAIILAAGLGRRLGRLTRDNTKCMLPVNGKRIIDRLLEQISAAGIRRVVIVVGYQRENLIRHIGNRYDESLEKIVEISKLRRGDIVCFHTNLNDKDLSDHTGIYIGGGLFIHASSSAKKVIRSTLASGYYNERFSWGRRVLQ